MKHILQVKDIRATAQCIDGIKRDWALQVPAEWGTYEHCMKHGVPLDIAEKSRNPIIMAGVAHAKTRIAHKKRKAELRAEGVIK